MNDASPTTKAASDSGSFVLAICEDFNTIGYVGSGRSLVPGKDARRFASEDEARQAGLRWESEAEFSTIYAVVRQVAPPCDIDGSSAHRYSLVEGRYYANVELCRCEPVRLVNRAWTGYGDPVEVEA